VSGAKGNGESRDVRPPAFSTQFSPSLPFSYSYTTPATFILVSPYLAQRLFKGLYLPTLGVNSAGNPYLADLLRDIWTVLD
jgi:hypothetical protein